MGKAGGRVLSGQLCQASWALTFKRISGFSLGAMEASGRALKARSAVGPSERWHFERLSDT